MSDWSIGDLALCVDNGVRYYEPRGNALELGRIYKVGAVGIPETVTYVCLGFRCLPSKKTYGWAFDARRFRKVVGDKHEACEPEFVTLLKRARVPA